MSNHAFRVAMMLLVAVELLAGCRKQAASPDPDQGRAVADQFLEQARTGKAGEAWNGTSAEFKSAEGRESFIRNVKKLKWLTKPTTFETIEMIPAGAGERAQYVYRSADGKHRVRLLLAPAGDTWCVDRWLVD